MGSEAPSKGLEWQKGVWDRMSKVYLEQIDQRFAPVVEGLIDRAGLRHGEDVLDLGTGTGSVAARALEKIGPPGSVTAVDISPEMLARARERFAGARSERVRILEGSAEKIPCEEASFDVVLAGLSMMYVIDRPLACSEIARVLRPMGRFVAAVWAGSESSDIVLFQQTAGRFADAPPVPGVGPGALADPSDFIDQLAAAGLDAVAGVEVLGFEFPDFESAWNALAGVTTAQLSPQRKQEAKDAVRDAMYPDGDGFRRFENATHYIVGRKRS